MPPGQFFRDVIAFVFEQVTQVLARQHPENRAALRRAPGELEIHQRGRPVGCDQPVGLLGEVIVGNPRPVQAAQQRQCLAVVARIERPCLLHRLACYPAALKHRPVPAEQGGYPVHPVCTQQGAGFAARQPARDGAGPHSGRRGVAPYPLLFVVLDPHDPAKQIGFELGFSAVVTIAQFRKPLFIGQD